MRCFSLRAVALLLGSVVLLCGSFIAGQTSAAADSKSADTKTSAELLKADRDFFAATKARKTDGWMEFMTEETAISREKPYVGLAAIRAAVAEDYKDPNYQLTWDPETAVLLESGKVGYTSGHWIVTTKTPDGKVAKLGGQYITVWKKQKDGTWKVLWDGGSATGPVK